jgi:hypothetical protein
MKNKERGPKSKSQGKTQTSSIKQKHPVKWEMKNKERGPKFKAQGKTQTSSIKQSTQQRGK